MYQITIERDRHIECKAVSSNVADQEIGDEVESNIISILILMHTLL